MAFQIPPNWTESSFKCPTCNNPLFFIKDDNGVHIWCARGDEICPNRACNEGFHSNTEKNAFEGFKERVSK